MRLAHLILSSVLLAVAVGNHAVAQSVPTAPATSSAQQHLGHWVGKQVVLRGTLGDQKIQMSLQPKPDEDGLEGTYFVFGQTQKILLAGEVQDNDLVMEESRNGKDVSGQWEGSLQGDTISGTWTAPDGSDSKPFVLKLSPP